jgi:hypothetical protein
VIQLNAIGFESRGSQFIGFTNFSAFTRSSGENSGEIELTSPEISTRIAWDQLILSWNESLLGPAQLKIDARAILPEGPTKYYRFAIWSGQPESGNRRSVSGQKDRSGDVATDTLVLAHPAERAQVRITLRDMEVGALRFLGLCFTDGNSRPAPLAPNRKAWGRIIDVPERSQMNYTNGEVLCSPATVSMMMTFWSRALQKPQLACDVPDVVREVYDSNWQGTGNWAFNMAYAGSKPGLRAYVTRLSDVSELEDWIAKGIPVGLSVCYNRLRGKPGPPSGHLVVCVGFTADGQVVVNDPGTRLNTRKTFPRKNLIDAWANSHNAVYLIYPEGADLPEDRFGHWALGTESR